MIFDDPIIPYHNCMKNPIIIQLESSAQISHNELKIVIDYQTHHRLRETQGNVAHYWRIHLLLDPRITH